WIRSRQEMRELRYWLSAASYDSRDQSFNNRIYLVYLILFFGILAFVTLTFLAGSGAVLLKSIAPEDPARAAAFLQLLLLGIWSFYSLIQALRRSPIVFSEPDAYLLCQMPVNRRQVVVRWLIMPWFKSTIPFWLVAITLGFSLAETTLPSGAAQTVHIMEYIGYGLRAWLAILPVHFALFVITWLAGTLRLKTTTRHHWLALLAPGILCLLGLALLAVMPHGILSSPLWISVADGLAYPTLAGFGQGSYGLGLSASAIFAACMLAILAWVSGSISLCRTAEETQETELIASAAQYGFSDLAQQLRNKQHLGVGRISSTQSMRPGVMVLVWKDIVQSLRLFRLSSLMSWMSIFGAFAAFPFLPGISGMVALVIWTMQVGKVSIIRLRNDLACWSIIRQLPFSARRFIRYDLAPAYLLTLLVNWIALGFGTALLGLHIMGWMLLVPGMALSVFGISAFDILRRSKSDFLMNGSVPDVSSTGVLLGAFCAVVPYLIASNFPGFTGMVIAMAVSLGLGLLAMTLADQSYRRV
ncbi:MAG: hypothetical protein ABFD44_06645, partial [Anaerolineaceae bacterium]